MRRIARVLCCLAFALSLPGFGQQELAEGEVFETATVVAQPIAESGQAVEVIATRDLLARGQATVGDALEESPGVFVADGPRSASISAQIRGGDPNFVLVLLDGVPLNDSTDSLGGAFAVSSLSLLGLETLEVVQGATSSFYGSSAMSGVIQLIPERSGPRFSARLQFGEDDSLQVGLTADVLPKKQRPEASNSAQASENSLRLSVVQEEEAERIGRDEFEQFSALASGRLKVLDSSLLSFVARHADLDTADYAEGSGGPRLGSGELRHSETLDQLVGSNLLVSGARTSQRYGASVRRRELGRSSPAIGFLVPPGREETEYEQQRVYATALGDLGGSWELSGGGDLVRESAQNRSALFLPDFLGGDLVGDYAETRNTRAVFAMAQSRKTGAWGSLTLELGGRADFLEGADDEFSPRIAFAFQPGESRIRIRTSYAEAFKLPSFYALGSPRALGGNPLLRAESSEGLDLSVEWVSTLRRHGVTLTGFEQDYADLIDFDFAAFQLVNRSSVTAQGLEFGYRFEVLPELNIQAAATWQKVEDRQGLSLLGRPDFFGNVRVNWEVGSRWALSAAGRWIGERLDEQVPVEGRRALEDYGLMEVGVSWAAGDWQFGASVGNALNERYETQLGFPGPGRTALLSAHYRR